jgi:lysozyme
MLGIDISQFQGDLTDAHWKTIAASGKRFVYLRSGVGNEASDTHFARYLAGARAARLVVGAYHFVFPLPSAAGHAGREPEDQAQAHYEACSGLGSRVEDLPPAMDIEWPEPERWEQWGCSAAQVTDWALRYLTKASSLYGRVPVVYSYPWWIKAAGLGGLGKYPLWLASYQAATPAAPSPWSRVTIQQTSAGGFALPNGARADEDTIIDPDFFPHGEIGWTSDTIPAAPPSGSSVA